VTARDLVGMVAAALDVPAELLAGGPSTHEVMQDIEQQLRQPRPAWTRPPSLPFWSDDFDTDLLKVVPGAAAVLARADGVRLWTYGGTTHDRLNHPCVWGGNHGWSAFFGTHEGGWWLPGSYSPSKPLVECTWTEAVRDAWVHNYLIVVDGVPAWNNPRLNSVFTKLMYDVRGWTPLPDDELDRMRGNVLASLIAATRQICNAAQRGTRGGP
jgi:hypothetical protein